MPGENIQDWSTTAATNATSDTLINWAEGQPRASVNNSARSMMAAHAKDRNLKNGSITTGGTANAQTFTSGVTYTTVPTGLTVRLKIGFTNTGAATLNMDGISAVTIKDQSGNDLGVNALAAGEYAEFLFNGTNWILLSRSAAALAALAPFDALAYNGMQINGSMEVDQPNAGVSVAVAAGTVAHANLMDGWYCAKTGTNAISVQQTTSVFPGYAKELKLTVTTAQASIGSDTVDIRQAIEGYRTSRLAWGTASATPLTIGFWVKSSVAGTLSLLASNSTLATNATASVTITSANVAQYVTATFSAQTTGTWLTDNSAGIILSIRAAGSGSINIAATNANTFEMTGVVVLPGTQGPSVAQAPLIMRPYDQELLMCKRYYDKLTGTIGNGQCVSTTFAVVSLYFQEKRALPTLGVLNLSSLNLKDAAAVALTLTNVNAAISSPTTVSGQIVAFVASGLVAGNATILYGAGAGAITLDARL